MVFGTGWMQANMLSTYWCREIITNNSILILICSEHLQKRKKVCFFSTLSFQGFKRGVLYRTFKADSRTFEEPKSSYYMYYSIISISYFGNCFGSVSFSLFFFFFFFFFLFFGESFWFFKEQTLEWVSCEDNSRTSSVHRKKNIWYPLAPKDKILIWSTAS